MSEIISQLATDIYLPISFLLILGGLFFIFYSRFVQYKYFKHAGTNQGQGILHQKKKNILPQMEKQLRAQDFPRGVNPEQWE